ncbi:hypothetical protein I4U23_004014 [Adineta vaga]|nr:hypothetical protein I4U23_004014 [Adineta vaga]
MTVSQFNFYYTQNDSDRYCLLLFDDNMRNLQQPIGETSISIHHILPYCLRLKEEEDYITVFGDLQNVTVPSFTFIELKERNITSEMLLSWSSTIDLAEEYEIFLMNESSSLLNIKTFYNCTSFWFGPFCRFKFDYSTSQSFYNVVRISFRTKRVISNKLSKVPCYVHLSCKTYLSCLDWREICDGNSDCMDGEDEQNCWQLEVNQCTYEEYRCHNGQCIPMEFVRDAIGYSDCFDQTDEPVKLIKPECYLSPSFLCEKRTYRSIALDFSCTDGEYTDGLTTCNNGYSSFLTDDFCSEAMRCLMDLGYVPGSFCIRCKHSNCIKKNCPILFEFRAIPPIFGHIRLLFSNTISWYDTNPLPLYLCYDDKLCENIFPDIEYIDNFTCHRLNLSELGETRSYITFRGLVYLIKNRFRSCLLIQNEYHYCNYSSMYQCKNSRKCIANQRLMDGFRDCRENDDEEYKQSCLLADVQHRFRCSDDESKCFSSIVVNDGLHNCEFIDDDEHTSLERYNLKHIDFLNICDGKTNLFPIKFEDHYETDETNCEYWPCNNIYTRCNKIWNCPNAIDEMYCFHSLISTFENSCLFPNIIQNEICPSVNQTDKQYIHQTYSNDGNFGYNHCWNDTTYMPYITFCDRSSPSSVY